MATTKSIVVGEVTFASKSEAIRDMLSKGIRKSEISKACDAHYSFVVGVERSMMFANSEVGQQMVADKAAKAAARTAAKEAEAKLKADAKVVRAEAKLAKAVKPELEVAVAATPKAAKKARKVVTNKVPKSSKVNEDAIAEMLGQDDIPAEILADMKADGLVA